MTLWTSQWELFAPGFKDGKAHIDLSPYNCPTTLLLLPGPGFGDFSHPTTRLTLQLMAPHVPHQNVIDIGCGSGILSLAASALGATSIYGYDIDPGAVSHALSNKALNHSRATFHTSPPPSTEPSSILLMNMISSEQNQAWNAFLPSLSLPARLFTSGVIDAERAAYLEWAASNDWELKDSAEADGWWAFEFIL